MIKLLLGFLTAAGIACSASAETPYPTKPIRLVVTLAPGSQPDIVARVLAERMQASLGQPVIVENRPGADGTIGTELVARSAADGYTLLYALGGSLTVAPALYGSRVRYESEKDFAPITQTVRTTVFLTANAAFPASDLKSLASYTSTHPRTTTLGHTAGTPYLMALLLRQAVSDAAELVAYKGNSEVATDLLAGRIQAGLSSLPGVQPYIKGGKLKALAVLSPSRSDLMPEVPSSAEEGFSDFNADTWNAVLAPAGTPATVIERLHREIVRILAAPEIRERLTNAGVEIKTSNPTLLAQLIRDDKARWTKVIADFHVTTEK